MKTTAVLLALVLLTSGCLCCKLPGGGGDKTASTTKAAVDCTPPYIKSGTRCCLDKNDNGVCDKNEVSTTKTNAVTSRQAGSQTTRQAGSQASSQSTTTALVTVESSEPTTEITTTEVTTATTTTKPVNPKAECAKQYVTPGTLLYLYTEECCSNLEPTIDAVEVKGYAIRHINMAHVSPKDTEILLCYFSSSTLADMFVPQVVCTANGNTILITNPFGANTKITNFAEECMNAV